MSEGKYPFEDAPDAKNAFSNAEQNTKEMQENIQQDITQDEPKLEYKPPALELNPNEFSQNSYPAILKVQAHYSLHAEHSQENEKSSKDSSLDFLGNPIQTDVSLNEAWDKAQSQDNSFDEGAEQ